MGKKRNEPEYVTLRLEATVLPDEPTELVTQGELCALLGGLTDTTIRNLVAKGMPRQGTERRPLYDAVECSRWYWTYVGLRNEHPNGVGRLSVEGATRENLKRQMKDQPHLFAVVPLEHNHPLRAATLRIAAEGIPSRRMEDDAV